MASDHASTGDAVGAAFPTNFETMRVRIQTFRSPHDDADYGVVVAEIHRPKRKNGTDNAPSETNPG